MGVAAAAEKKQGERGTVVADGGDKYLPEFVCLPTCRRQKKSPPLECYLSINPITGFIEGSKKEREHRARHINLLKGTQNWIKKVLWAGATVPWFLN